MVDPGTLFVVATPLGNLGDLSTRAAEVLRNARVVAAEDTRRTRGLLTPSRGPAYSSQLPRALGRTPAGGSAGNPPVGKGRSPRLGRRHTGGERSRRRSGCPGARTPESRLYRSRERRPLPQRSQQRVSQRDRYLFLGFIPRKGKERARLLNRAGTEEWSVVMFEAAPRLVALLADLVSAAGGERRAVVARELTKLHEEIRGGTLARTGRLFYVDIGTRRAHHRSAGNRRATRGAGSDGRRSGASQRSPCRWDEPARSGSTPDRLTGPPPQRSLQAGNGVAVISRILAALLIAGRPTEHSGAGPDDWTTALRRGRRLVRQSIQPAQPALRASDPDGSPCFTRGKGRHPEGR